MAYLYQRIMDVPGLSGSWQDRLKKFGKRFYGDSYRGSRSQNLGLLSKINKGDYGSSGSKSSGGNSDLIPGTNIPKPKTRTAFSEVLPFEKVFQDDLINEMALGQLLPDIERGRNQEMRSLGRDLARSGRWRTGIADAQRQQLNDAYARQLREQQNQFTNQIKDWTQDWYNRQSESYYKNPSGWNMPTLPTFDDYAKERGLDIRQGSGQTVDDVMNRWRQSTPTLNNPSPQAATPTGMPQMGEPQVEIQPVLTNAYK